MRLPNTEMLLAMDADSVLHSEETEAKTSWRDYIPKSLWKRPTLIHSSEKLIQSLQTYFRKFSSNNTDVLDKPQLFGKA